MIQIHKILPIVLLISLLGLVGTGYFYAQYRSAQKQLQNPKEAVKAETKTLVARVAKHILLPTGEEPQIVTISDKEKLAGQPFFNNAKNGDKVLIYNSAKKAILFDPIANIILEVAPVNPDSITSPQAAVGPTGTVIVPTTASVLSASTPASPTQTPVKIGIFNGTNVPGQTSLLEKDLQDKQVSFETVTKSNSNKKEYDKKLVVDITGKNKEEAARIARLFNASVVSLPPEEESIISQNGKSIDIAIIIGLDYVKSAPPTPTPSPGALLFP